VLGSLRRVPAPLLVLLAICLVEALAWCVALPPLQGPDEDAHVAYVQKIAEAREIPWVWGDDAGHPGPGFSDELGQAILDAGVASSHGNPSGRPAGTRVDEQAWTEVEAGLDRADRASGGFTSAFRNPPAYYLYAALPYLATSPMGIFGQLFVMRLANIPLLLVTVLFVWLIAGEVLGRRRWLQTLATGAVALNPMLTHMTAVVNPDVFLSAVWSVALYLMVVIVERGPTRRRAAALVALCVLSGFTHGRGLALVVPALLTLAIAAWKARRPGARPTRRGALALGAVATAVAGAAFVYVALEGAISAAGMRQLASYLWQFYLPSPSFLTALGPDYGLRDVVVERLYGGFAQLEVNFSPALNDTLWTGIIVVALSAAVALVRHRRLVAERWEVAVVLVAAAVASMGLQHAIAFRSLAFGSGDPIITGRYLLPLSSLFGIAVALAFSWLPRRPAIAGAGALLAALVLVQLGALGITVVRFYA
jgi:predicted membrane protein DUF2142